MALSHDQVKYLLAKVDADLSSVKKDIELLPLKSADKKWKDEQKVHLNSKLSFLNEIKAELSRE